MFTDLTDLIEQFLLKNPEIKEKLDIYQRELLKWNKKINLISKKEDLHSSFYHFKDSVSFSLLLPEHSNLLDVGTGAGFPGLVVAVCKPDIDVTLMEPISKKTAFLSYIKSKLNLQNVTIINERLTPEDNKYHRKNAVCRALTDLKEWENLARNTAENLWFLASETQSNNTNWQKKGFWKSELHGKRFILKREL